MKVLRASQMMSCGLVMTFFLSASAIGSTPTWEYDADDNVFPTTAGQPFEGGFDGAPAFKSLIDLGGGDIVLQINTQDPDLNDGSFYQQLPNTTPGTEWDVDPTVGYSLEWRVRLDGTVATEAGSADLAFADGVTASSMRLTRGAGEPSFNITVKSLLNNTPLAVANLSSFSIPGFDPDEFHTFRVDVLNTFIDVYLDDVLLFGDVVDSTASTINEISFGDSTGVNDGKSQTQFLRTYQDGVAPSPLTPGDFDSNGTVDGMDFLLWQRGGSPTPLSSSDLADWESNYGAGTLVGAVSGVSLVPEPSTGILCLAALLTIRRDRRRR